VFRIPPELFHTEDWFSRFQLTMEQAGLTSVRGVVLIVGQNVRVLAVASILGVFSFGVLTVMILMIPLGLVGFLSAHIAMAGLDPALAWAALLPHSVVEIPAALLAGAAALRLGATVIAPPPGKTVGEAWMEALADATRLWFTLILPLLLLAAVVEVFVTPIVVGWVVGGG
jgi:stage II sporulation protein M